MEQTITTTKSPLIRKLLIQLFGIILIIDVITLIVGIFSNNYSYFYGSLLGGIGSALYFLLLVFLTSLIVKPPKNRSFKKNLFLRGFVAFSMKMSIFAITILIAFEVNYNSNSGNVSLWEESLHPINWWLCFLMLSLPWINAFLINLPIYNIKKNNTGGDVK